MFCQGRNNRINSPSAVEGTGQNGGVMDNFTFGITMLVCGMGGTILILWIMSLVMGFLGKLFPEKPAKKEA